MNTTGHERAFPIVIDGAMRSFRERDFSNAILHLEVALALVKELDISSGIPIPPSPEKVNRVDANRANILRILEENDWNIARVSRELGVTRRTLYMRLEAFGIARKKVPRLAKPLK